MQAKYIAVVALAAAIAISCTGKSDTEASGGNAETAATKTVKVSDNSYSRSSITIVKNDKVKFAWQNTDNRHNVRKDSGPASVSSETRSGNYVFTKKFTKSGNYSLFCSRHPDDMQLSVKVKKN
jgi:plastocyanin